MIDVLHIENYRENNRIEAKRALGGLPKSLWETYSAFANTLGGVILLGVEEHKDKSLHPVNLPDPEQLIAEFWEIMNHSGKVSVNILSAAHVAVEVVNGNRIIVITVPRAERYDKPVFIDKDPFSGSYRRNGEGDYKCTKEEVEAMFRDAAMETQDMELLEAMTPDVFDDDTICRYRDCMRRERPGHTWESLDDAEFLYKLGATGRGADGKLHPTAAGLLMFGRVREIEKEYPSYALVYEERLDGEGEVLCHPVSCCANVYEFYSLVGERLVRGIEKPEPPGAVGRKENAALAAALREALLNCLVNADYRGFGGVVIVKTKQEISLSNPGGFRIDLADAKSGGVSDPRNAALARMFHFLTIGEGAGNGILTIYSTWKAQNRCAPRITESFAPERITVTFDLTEGGGKRPRRRPGGKVKAIKIDGKSLAMKRIHKQRMIEYLTYHVSADAAEIAEHIPLKPLRARQYLAELAAEGIVTIEGTERDKVYKLKA